MKYCSVGHKFIEKERRIVFHSLQTRTALFAKITWTSWWNFKIITWYNSSILEMCHLTLNFFVLWCDGSVDSSADIISLRFSDVKLSNYILRVRSLRKSKIGFWNPKESESGFCVSLLNRSIQDVSDYGASKESSADSSVPLKHHDPRDLGFICLIKKSNKSVFGFFRILECNLGFSLRNAPKIAKFQNR